MRFKRLLLAGLLMLLSVLPSLVAAQDDQLAAIRNATDKYRQVETALADGYAPQFGCVTHREHGAMGIHHIYALHIWLWRENPAGLYTGYNPTVACPAALATFPNAAAAAIAPAHMPATSGNSAQQALIGLALVAGGLTLAGWLVRRTVRRAR